MATTKGTSPRAAAIALVLTAALGGCDGTYRKPALPDADEWNGKPGKIANLIK